MTGQFLPRSATITIKTMDKRKTGEIPETKKRFLLLQLNDAFFPVGLYAHSYGLETYIQKEAVKDESSAYEFICNMLLYGIGRNEALAMRLSYQAVQSPGSDQEKLLRLFRLDELVRISRTPEEIRNAGEKTGSRFLKTVAAFTGLPEHSLFRQYAEESRGQSHAVAYGVYCAVCGIAESDALEHFLYAQASFMVTNCVKTIPLSQMKGQKILAACTDGMDSVIRAIENYTEEDFGAETPGFEIRSMQHEALYSRLYMS